MRRVTKMTVLVMALIMVLGCTVLTPTVSARWTYIMGTLNDIQLFSGGRIHSDGTTEVLPSYKAKVTVELQQNDGGWKTIKTWSDTATWCADVCEDWYVVKGYQYRLKLTHQALNSSNTVLETFNNYSSTINYY